MDLKRLTHPLTVFFLLFASSFPLSIIPSDLSQPPAAPARKKKRRAEVEKFFLVLECGKYQCTVCSAVLLGNDTAKKHWKDMHNLDTAMPNVATKKPSHQNYRAQYSKLPLLLKNSQPPSAPQAQEEEAPAQYLPPLDLPLPLDPTCLPAGALTYESLPAPIASRLECGLEQSAPQAQEEESPAQYLPPLDFLRPPAIYHALEAPTVSTLPAAIANSPEHHPEECSGILVDLTAFPKNLYNRCSPWAIQLNRKLWKCCACPFTRGTKDALIKEHIMKIHFNGRFGCTKCSLLCGTEEEFKLHLNESALQEYSKPHTYISNTGSDSSEFPFICPRCRKKFKNQRFATLHTRETTKFITDPEDWR